MKTEDALLEELKALKLRVAQMDQIMTEFCKVYYQENKDAIDKKMNSYPTGYYFGSDREIIYRAIRQEKQREADKANTALEHFEKEHKRWWTR